MASNDGSIQTAAEQWSSLLKDLLSMVYARLTSLDDRVRFAAVCTSWRAIALTCPPRPVLPWLMLDPRGGDKTKHVYCPKDNSVVPYVPIPREAAGGRFIGGYDGGWVVSSEAPLGIVNLFSGAEVVYSPEQRRVIRAQQSTGDMLVMQKVVFSTAPTSSGCILAAITDKHGLALCKVDCPEGGWTTRGFYGEERLMDIAFCGSELYGLMRYRDWLIKFEIGVNEQGAPVLIAVHRLTVANSPHYDRDPGNYCRYIVELRGKLIMALRLRFWWWRHKPSFTLLKLVDGEGDKSMETHNYMWENMVSLGDHALFLGWMCSKAVLVPEGGLGGVKRNHVYYSHHQCLRRDDKIPDDAKVFFRSSINGGDRVYYKEDNSANGGVDRFGVDRFASVDYYVKGGASPPMWILPPDI